MLRINLLKPLVLREKLLVLFVKVDKFLCEFLKSKGDFGELRFGAVEVGGFQGEGVLGGEELLFGGSELLFEGEGLGCEGGVGVGEGEELGLEQGGLVVEGGERGLEGLVFGGELVGGDLELLDELLFEGELSGELGELLLVLVEEFGELFLF